MNTELWLLALGLVAGIVLYRFVAKRIKQRKLAQVSKRAKLGEKEAEKLLQSKGYTILSSQERRSVVMYLDGEPCESFVRADYIVKKGGKTYLAEVKTGKQANVHLPNVRRQLFEYQNIFDTDGILFIDMNNYAIIEVSFNRSKAINANGKYFLAGVFTGVCLMAFILSF